MQPRGTLFPCLLVQGALIQEATHKEVALIIMWLLGCQAIVLAGLYQFLGGCSGRDCFVAMPVPWGIQAETPPQLS